MRQVAPALTVLLVLAACGDDPPPAKPEFPENPGPITIDADRRGLPIEDNASYSANRVKYDTHVDDISALFIYEQVWSELEHATAGGAGTPELDLRVDGIYESFEDELAAVDTHYLVIDLQRLDREWIVDWEGLARDEPENREGANGVNFGRRDDYWPDVQDRLVAAYMRAEPDVVIIGMEMNRYYDQNPGDWDNFVSFYWTVADELRAIGPGLRIGPGLNWSYLVETNVQDFLEEGDAATDVEPLQRAYERIVAPLLTHPSGGIGSDVLGLAAIPDPALYNNDPSTVPDTHFAGLRLEERVGASLPVVWFQLGWPIRSAGSAAPGQFYSRFLELAGGHTIERVSWWGLAHFIDPDCAPLTGAQIGAPETICFKGMYSVSGAETALSEVYFPEAGGTE